LLHHLQNLHQQDLKELYKQRVHQDFLEEDLNNLHFQLHPLLYHFYLNHFHPQNHL
jgi:hypothetical protein